MKRDLNKIAAVLILFTLTALSASAQDFPVRPVPPRLVNDFAGMLGQQEITALENKLVAFNDSSSTQIAIVILNDLNGYEIKDYGQRLAEKWGIGQKGMNNGLLILVKTKSENERGDVAIVTGYGLEGVIPDITCGQIIDSEILPAFRNGQYYAGLDRATDVLISLARGEFPSDKYKPSNKSARDSVAPVAIIIIIFVVLMAMRSGGGKNNRHISNKGLPLWLLLSMMNSGRNSHHGSWGGFSGGGGFGGGGGGGFGGFGGGSFGGGGASGSW